MPMYDASNAVEVEELKHPRKYPTAEKSEAIDEKYMRDNISTVAFKYGGKITVVGYITNKVMA